MATCSEGLQKVVRFVHHGISYASFTRCQKREIASTFVEASIEISMRDGTKIPSLVYTPTPSPWAAAVFAHGGCFSLGDCKSQSAICTMLASRGIAVVASSYRQGSQYPHPSALLDLTDVASFANKELWPALPMGIVGSSSGGWYALALARPEETSLFQFCIALCPVAHPGRRAAYLRSCIDGTPDEDGFLVEHTPERAREMLSLQLGYWQTDDAMEKAGELLLAPSSVPTCMILGSNDKNIPYQVTIDVQNWATKTIVLGGYGHSLQEKDPEDQIASFASDLERFVRDVVLGAPRANVLRGLTRTETDAGLNISK